MMVIALVFHIPLHFQVEILAAFDDATPETCFCFFGSEQDEQTWYSPKMFCGGWNDYLELVVHE